MNLLWTMKVFGWKQRRNQIGKKTSEGLKDFLVFAEKCLEKPDPGPCRAAFKNFYYNPDAGSCQEFFYGGCRGNRNRYQSLAECLDTCGKKSLDAVKLYPSCNRQMEEVCLSSRWSASWHQVWEPLDCRSVSSRVRPAFKPTNSLFFFSCCCFLFLYPSVRPLPVCHLGGNLSPPAGCTRYPTETPQCPP